MKSVDRLLQWWRNAKARPYIACGARVLDVGCGDGALFRQLKPLIGEGVGIDPTLRRSVDREDYRLIAGWFPDDLPDERPFDVITMLAVLEHVPPARQPRLAQACRRLLKEGGYLVITVPAPSADHVLRLLQWMRLIDGMSLEQHYGFDPKTAPAIFCAEGLALVKFEKFQLGFNNLLVFKRTAEPERLRVDHSSCGCTGRRRDGQGGLQRAARHERRGRRER